MPHGTVFTYGHPLDDLGCDLQATELAPDPTKFPGPTYPFCFVIHGGGFRDKPNSPGTYQSAVDAAAAGYVTWLVDYRLAPPGDTNGKGPPGQTTPGYYPKSVVDIRMAMAFARLDSRFNGKLVGMGGSAGAYFMALLCGTGTFGVDRFDGGVALSGPYDFSDRSSDVSAGFISDVTNYCNTTDLPTLLADSVVSQIDALIAPLLFYNSTQDPMPPSQYSLLVAKLTALGVTNFSAPPLIPGTAHAFAYWQAVKMNAIDWINAAQPGGVNPPPPSGTKEMVTVSISGMDPSTNYEFGVAAVDKSTGQIGDTATYDFVSDPAMIPGSVKDPPLGVFCLIPAPGGIPGDLTNRAWWGFSYVNGSRFRAQWNVIQTAPTTFDWSALDAYLALCVTHSKDASISISAGIYTPDFIKSQCQLFSESGPDPGTIPLPWDATFLKYWKKFIQAFSARYDTHPNLKAVVMGGMGQVIETYIVKDTDYAAFNAVAVGAGYADANAGWSAGAQQVMAYWIKSMQTTRCYLSIATPFPPANGGLTNISDLVDLGIATYGKRLGIMNAGLNGGTEGLQGTIHYILKNAIPTNATAYQFGHPSGNPLCDPTQDPNSYDPELGLRDAANAGIDIASPKGVPMEEIYEGDILNTNAPYPADFATFQTALLANSPV